MSHGTTESWWERIAEPVLGVPVDLVCLVGFVALTDLSLVHLDARGTPLAVVLGLPLILFAPGYALVSFCFPGESAEERRGWARPNRIRRDGVTPPERLALAFGVSLAVLPPLGLALSLAGAGITAFTVLAGVSAVTVVGSVLGAARRLRLPADERFSLSLRKRAGRLRSGLFGGSAFDTVLSVALALSVVVALSAMGYAFAVPTDGEEFSQLSLLNQTEDGEFAPADPTMDIQQGEGRPMFVSVENYEGERVSYTVVVELQRVEQRPDGSARVLEERELDRFGQRVDDGESWRTAHTVEPTMTGQDLRLVYLLYRGEPPADPTVNNADEHAHVWVNVTG